MKRGFTLLELLIVIIIVGIMATLGLTQYTTVVERSRGAEARQVLGQLRSLCAALFLDVNSVASCNATTLGYGDGTAGTIPSTACSASHYFRYTSANTLPNLTIFTATRCAAGGKNPQGLNTRSLAITADYGTGTATWGGNYGY